MKKDRNIGQEILAGIKEIKEWQQGKKKLKTTHMQLPRAADVAKIRQNLDLTQDEFANFMGVNIRTLQNWEQKRREPQGPARCLLRIAEKAPEAILKVLPRKTDRHRKNTSVARKKKAFMINRAHTIKVQNETNTVRALLDTDKRKKRKAKSVNSLFENLKNKCWLAGKPKPR